VDLEAREGFAGTEADNAMIIVRWILVIAAVAYGLRRRSLTTWILVSIVIGAEIGNDWPGIAVNLRVLSLIFLNLIRTIIAPLLFATLVVGIAGHPDLRQVGRMGVKALVYFEVVTTLALFIGLAAINVSHAGVGIAMAQPSATALPTPAPPQSLSDTILHIFPENIAKAIAEGQILQIVVFSIIFGIALALVAETKLRPVL
jgi:proton glutamate symport protein